MIHKSIGNMNRSDFHLHQTCGACPEQYDLYFGDQKVGYFRLRHGYFYVAYPDVGGEIVYESNTRGDGAFEADERERELNNGIDAIISKMSSCKDDPIKYDADILREQYSHHFPNWLADTFYLMAKRMEEERNEARLLVEMYKESKSSLSLQERRSSRKHLEHQLEQEKALSKELADAVKALQTVLKSLGAGGNMGDTALTHYAVARRDEVLGEKFPRGKIKIIE